MTAVALPAARPPVSRVPQLIGIAFLACAWCAGLTALIFVDSNPVVLNRVQLQAATFVVQGQLTRGSPTTLQVARVWKGTLPETSLVITDALPVVIPEGEIIVPISRGVEPGEYRITQGVLPNYGEGSTDPNADSETRPAQVQPLVYPVTPDILRQLEVLWPENAAAAHTSLP